MSNFGIDGFYRVPLSWAPPIWIAFFHICKPYLPLGKGIPVTVQRLLTQDSKNWVKLFIGATSNVSKCRKGSQTKNTKKKVKEGRRTGNGSSLNRVSCGYPLNLQRELSKESSVVSSFVSGTTYAVKHSIMSSSSPKTPQVESTRSSCGDVTTRPCIVRRWSSWLLQRTSTPQVMMKWASALAHLPTKAPTTPFLEDNGGKYVWASPTAYNTDLWKHDHFRGTQGRDLHLLDGRRAVLKRLEPNYLLRSRLRNTMNSCNHNQLAMTRIYRE